MTGKARIEGDPFIIFIVTLCNFLIMNGYTKLTSRQVISLSNKKPAEAGFLCSTQQHQKLAASSAMIMSEPALSAVTRAFSSGSKRA